MAEPSTEAVPSASKPAHGCDICHFPPWLDDFNIAQYASEDIEKSADRGCFGCRLLCALLDLVPAEEKAEYSVMTELSSGVFTVMLLRDYGTEQVEVFMLPDCDPLPNFKIGRLPPRTTDLEESLPKIKQWLQCCESSHERCQQSSNYMPPRLLDLSPDSADTVRLVELYDPAQVQENPGAYPLEESAPRVVRYACLSHCWGVTGFPRGTSRENIAANKAAISIADLPTNFRDAIRTARALGVNYLWIDSLCIIQDDEADWNFHVKAMAPVYQNAFITLAAGDSSDMDGGLFRRPPPGFAKPPSLTYRDDQGKEYVIYYRLLGSHPDQMWSPLSRLLARGWVFQERLLSRRFLCFGEYEIQWECLEDVACSCSTTDDGFNWQPRDQDTKPAFPRSPATKSEFARLKELEPEAISMLWKDIVGEYSERRLTVHSDRLPALAGLASLFLEAKTDVYVNGLWLDTLKTDLSWRIAVHRKRQHNGRSQSIATWSWAAACEGNIQWVADIFDSRWQILEVKDTSLKLSGHLEPIFLITIGDVDEEMSPLERHCTVNRRLEHVPDGGKEQEISRAILSEAGYDVEDCEANANADSKYPNVQPFTWPSTQNDLGQPLNVGLFFADFKFWDTEDDMRRKHLPCLFLFHMGKLPQHQIPFGHPPGEQGWAHGLVLKERKDLSNAETGPPYERVGLLYFHTGKEDNAWDPQGLDSIVTIV